MKNRKLFQILYIVYLIAIVLFIFSNSLPSMEESAETSGRLLNTVNTVLDSVGLPKMESDTLIRKTAHFVEFFVLGASLFGYTILTDKVRYNCSIYCAFASCLIAMADETIQYFSERGSLLTDVWLDLFGAVVAITLFHLIYSKRKKKI